MFSATRSLFLSPHCQLQGQESKFVVSEVRGGGRGWQGKGREEENNQEGQLSQKYDVALFLEFAQG